MGKDLIQVVAGAHIKYIDNIAFVLLGLKPNGKWEFPGGKIENQETHQQAMEREWMEELGVGVQCGNERFGHARYGRYEVWFYEVEIDESTMGTEPSSIEHVEVNYFRLDEASNMDIHSIDKAMVNKLVDKYI